MNMTTTRFDLMSVHARASSPAPLNHCKKAAFVSPHLFFCSIDEARPLKIAAQAGNLHLVQLLVDSGANVSKDSLTWDKVSGPVAEYLRSAEAARSESSKQL
jgi:hypothetical protein